jgi:hypothetical protein
MSLLRSAAFAPGLALPRVRLSPAATYWLAVLLIFGPASGFYLLAPLGTESPLRDGWHHVAVLRELMHAPFSPLNPHVATSEPSRFFGPIQLALALTGRALGLDVWQVFGLGAVLSLLLFATGVAAFASRYLSDRWAPLILLLCLLFAWGTRAPSHTGYHNLRTLWVSAGYPASMLFGLGLLMWRTGLDLASASRGRLALGCGLAALTALAVITHQLGAGFAIGGLGVFALFAPDASWRGRAAVAAAVAAGLLAAGLWPYFDVYALVASGGDPQWRSDTLPDDDAGLLLALAGFALFGLAGLRDPRTGRIDRTLALGLLGLVATWAAGTALASPVAHRLVPMIIFFLQIGLAAAIVRHRQVVGRLHPALVGAGVVVAAFVLLKSLLPLVAEQARRARDGDPLAALTRLDAALPAGAILFADDDSVYPIQSTGHRVVSIPRPEPTVRDMAARQAATDRFFAPATSNGERLALARRHGATHAATSIEHGEPATRAAIAALGEPARYRDIVIVALAPERRP